MKRRPGIPRAARSARAAAPAAAGRAWRGLIQVLIGPDPPPVWRWRSPQQRQVAYAALGVATLALCVINLVPGVAEPGQLLLALPVVAPLPLAARYPMLAWRIGWLALLLAPLVPATWWGGWPWGRGAGPRPAGGVLPRRHPPAAAGTVVDVGADPHPVVAVACRHAGPDGPASATIVFTAAVIAVDSTGSRLRAQQALAAQTERAED